MPVGHLICGIVGVLAFLLTYIALSGLGIWLVTNTGLRPALVYYALSGQ
jgi:hypothetical protein